MIRFHTVIHKYPINWRIPLTVIACVPAVLGMLSEGFPETHDGAMHLYRIVAFEDLLTSGITFPRWVPDFAYGYGYPLFSFYPPGSMYIAVAIKALLPAGGLIVAFKLSFVIAILLAAFGIVKLLSEILYPVSPSLFASFVAVTVSIGTPFRLLDIYVRGSLPQCMAIAMVPWILVYIWRYYRSGKMSWWILFSVSTAGIVLLHGATTIYLLALVSLIFLFIIVGGRSKRRVAILLPALILSAGLTAFFWVPALSELQFVQIHRATEGGLHIDQHFLRIEALLQNEFIYNYRYDNGVFQLGLGYTLTCILGFLIAMIWGARRLRLYAYGLGIAWITLLILQTYYSKVVWESIPFASYTQFPWRLQGFQSIVAGLLLGIAVQSVLVPIPLFLRVPMLFSLCILFWLSSLTGLPVEGAIFETDVNMDSYPKWEAETMYIGTTSSGEYLPVWASKEILQARQSSKLMQDCQLQGIKLPIAKQITYSWISPYMVRIETVSANDSCIPLHILYFPGWNIEVDGTEVTPLVAPVVGNMQVLLSEGKHEVIVAFEDTPVRQVATTISQVSVILIAAIVLFSQLSRRPDLQPIRRRSDAREEE